MRPALLFALCIAAASLAGTAWAQAPADSVIRGYDDTRAQHLFGELMSPYCPGLTLATCPSSGADSLRDDIRMRLALGESPGAIRRAYAAAWGEQILGVPPWRGWGVVLWVMPSLVLAGAALVLVLWLRRARRRDLAGAVPAVAPDEPADLLDERLRKRLEEELAACDGR